MSKDVNINDEITFEEASVRLDQIIKLLENPQTSLDDMLSYYSEGIGLIKFCNKKLDEAEQKITVLGKKNAI